ncbi:ATP-dependent helicase HrpB [Glutamicibacter sp.]|uniref:ATP-dependent helicase HrpB n=1 Tax=Glutamicibacter sp. TaxID=1931995 RepID=UPI002B4A5F86|nr:ATP-dependent helicase HrpB [Glutamicibacter sp.]HJX77618.1 ATP-dependent helicase HrpB [Glutamicibacter sp.]
MDAQVFDLERIASGLAFGPSRKELQVALQTQPSRPLVIQAPPGSGKTTIVPPTVAVALAAQGLTGKIIVTQPRRVAARAAARRLAQLDGSRLGDKVGFAVRGERQSSANTQVEFVTAGLMLRRLLADPDLAGVSAVIIDEVHERSIDTDLLLAMVNQVSELRDDLSLIVMSATLHSQELSELLARDEPARVLTANTAQFEVTELFDSFAKQRITERGISPDYLSHVAQVAVKHSKLLNQSSTTVIDTLVFVPGAREVDRVCAQIAASGMTAFALHSQVPAKVQDQILAEPAATEGPRIIVSTSIAESSLTVPRVRLVVDAGYAREPRRDAGRGIAGLVTVVASRASATQRAGRAGRLGPGTVVRTLDAKAFAAAPASSAPEIRTGDLVQAALSLAAWGAPRGAGLRLWEEPPANTLHTDEEVLRALEAVDGEGKITALGERMVKIPADPRTARALLEGSEHFGSHPTAEAVALLASSERIANADLYELLQAIRRPTHPGHRAWEQETKRLEKLTGNARSQDASRALAGVCALAYPQWVAHKVQDHDYLLASGTRASLPRGSHLAHYEFLAITEVTRASTSTGAMIRRAVGIELEQVLSLLSQLHQVSESAAMVDGKISARKVESLGAIELASHPIKATKELGRKAAATALREQSLALFGEQQAFENLRRRMGVAHRLLGAPFVPVDEASLIDGASDWLSAGLEHLASGKPASKIDLAGSLRTLLPWEHAHEFDSLVPERLQVPSGSRIRIEYPPVDSTGPAVVAVKLQECFGLKDSPRLVREKLPVQFHLLSPKGSPLAVTEDLLSFFNGPYAQVRSEMRGKYPRHPWPEDPWDHQATAYTNNRLRREGKG